MVRAVVVMLKVYVLNVKWERREGNKEEKDTRNIVFSFPYKIRLEL